MTVIVRGCGGADDGDAVRAGTRGVDRSANGGRFATPDVARSAATCGFDSTRVTSIAGGSCSTAAVGARTSSMSNSPSVTAEAPSAASHRDARERVCQCDMRAALAPGRRQARRPSAASIFLSVLYWLSA